MSHEMCEVLDAPCIDCDLEEQSRLNREAPPKQPSGAVAVAANRTATFQASIYLAGDIETAKRWLRRFAFDHGMCVTVTPTTFIYTGGEETGLHVGLVNYPRFPSEPQVIHDLAVRLATGLVYECCQKTALVVSGLSTEWIQVQPPGARGDQHARPVKIGMSETVYDGGE
jgi:hypothetical protein